MSDSVRKSLISAVQENKLERVREMIDALGLSDSKDCSEGYVLLYHAVKNNRTDIIKLLLTRGCQVNNKSSGNSTPSNTPLHFAAKNENIEIVKTLLDRDADIEARNKTGRTPLHNAVYFRKYEIAELLLNRGANVVATDNNRATPLHIAVEMKDLPTFSHRNLSIMKLFRETVVAIIKMLLRKGANVNAEKKNGETPLYIASATGNKEIVEILLQWGAKVDSKHLLTTPLRIAAEMGYADIVEILLNVGADVDSGRGRSKTPLFIAIKARATKVVVALLAHGSDINVRYKHSTPLSYARWRLLLFLRHNYGYEEHDYVNRSICVWDKIIYVLSKHIIKLNTAKMYVKDVQEIYINYDFENKCKEEIKRIKSEKIILNNNISFHDILTKSVTSLAVYAKNENIVQALKLDDNRTKFPIYGGMITCNIRKGIKRKGLLEKCNENFLPSFTSISGLPCDCTEKIYTYLSDKDLQILIDASNPTDVSNSATNDTEVTSEM